MKILLAHDDEDVLGIWKQALEDEQHTVVTASSLEAVESELASHADVNMVTVGAFQTDLTRPAASCHFIQKVSKMAGVVLIGVSSDDERQQQMRGAGANFACLPMDAAGLMLTCLGQMTKPHAQ